MTDRKGIGPQNIGAQPGEEPIDPANGGCYNCGDKAAVRLFLLTDRFGIPAGRWMLCAPCHTWGQGAEQPDPDPLHVPEDYR